VPLASVCVKATHKIMMKLTPGGLALTVAKQENCQSGMEQVSNSYRKFYIKIPFLIVSLNVKVKCVSKNLTYQLSRRVICAVNFLPPCKKASPILNQKSELRVTLKKGYLLH